MKKYINTILTIILSLLIGLSFSLKRCIKLDNFIYSFSLIRFILWGLLFAIISFILINLLIYVFSKIKIKTGLFKVKKLFLISFISIFLTGLLFLIVHYPGVCFYDTLIVIDSPVAAAAQHPLFYNLAVGITFRVFNFIFNDVNISFFLTGLSQLIFCSTIISFIICWFNKTFKNKVFTIIILLYYSLLPIISNYNISLIKDSIFGVIFLLYIPLFYNLIISKGNALDSKRFLIIMTCLFLLTIFIRNNGLYVVMLTIISLLLLFKKHYKKLLIILLISLLASKIPNLFIKQEQLFQEKVGVMIQQIAYVIKYNEESISKDDLNYINKIMDVKLIKEKYEFYSVDPIKWDNNFNRDYLNKTKIKFIKTWLSISGKNISNYMKSHLLMSYDLWAIDKFNPVQSRMLELDTSGYNMHSSTFKDLKEKRILPEKMQNALDNYYEATTTYIGNALLIVILLFINLYAFIKKKKEALIISIPFLAVYITLLISAPISYALRYMSTYLYAIPIIILLILCYCNKRVKSK